MALMIKLKFVKSSIQSILPLILVMNFILLHAQDDKSSTNLRCDSFLEKSEPVEFKSPAHNAPAWLRDAIIVEIPIRGFNVSDYKHPENWSNPYGDGTYLSIIDKLDFLKQSGVNVICLYSVYWNTPETNLYALRHDAADPGLGTLTDIKTLIQKAHEKGFHVISNTNHYGVDPASPLIKEHPGWFLPEKFQFFEQRLFDINNPEVVKYIIDTHAWWCTEIGLDGWRIDVAHETYRKAIWDQILIKCLNAGKQILLAPEGVHLQGHIRGAGWSFFPPSVDMENPMLGWERKVPEFGTMKSFSEDTRDDPYNVKDISSHNSNTQHAYNCKPGTYGRMGAFNIKGSRYLFGYDLLFAPLVPWLMAGELFNATHLGVPALLNNELNGKLLHSYIDWNDLQSQADVIEDFRKIARIRINNKDIFHNNRYETCLVNVPYNSKPAIDVKPYARFIRGRKAIIVIGNNNTESDVEFRLQIPLKEMGLPENGNYKVSDLWNETTKRYKAEQLSHLRILVPKDKSKGGGVRVVLISPL